MKTVLITGAAGGIGTALAREFGQSGYQVVIHYNTSKANALALAKDLADHKIPAVAISADLTEEAEVHLLFQLAEKIYGKVDVLVNNAGIAQQKLFQDITLEEWNRMMAVNATAPFLCCQEALRRMLPDHRGKIINISSMWGQVGASCEVHYSASKAALLGLTKALAKEAGPSGIQVNAISPGVIQTQMNAHLEKGTMEALQEEIPLGSIGTPEEIAHLAVFLASDKANYITGQNFGVNGGLVI